MRTPVSIPDQSLEGASGGQSSPAGRPPHGESSVFFKTIPSPQPKPFTRLLFDKGETIAIFGSAELHCRLDGGWEIRGGTDAERAAAAEWHSGIQTDLISIAEPSVEAAPQAEQPKSSRNRVLIADDNALVRGSLAAVLEYEGFLVDEAADGFEAVSQAALNRPGLVLLDLNMPRMDGWTTFARLERVCPLVPVIVITARPNQYRLAVELGVDAFMEKPLVIPLLIEAAKSLANEDEKSRLRRVTQPAFVTRLLTGETPCPL